jgi:ABC-type multidrug transport system fused ATPase/permease subunit
MAADPPASLDAATEESLMAALDQLTKGRNDFLIAHRRATIRRADRIISLGEGHLREEVFA